MMPGIPKSETDVAFRLNLMSVKKLQDTSKGLP